VLLKVCSQTVPHNRTSDSKVIYNLMMSLLTQPIKLQSPGSFQPFTWLRTHCLLSDAHGGHSIRNFGTSASKVSPTQHNPLNNKLKVAFRDVRKIQILYQSALLCNCCTSARIYPNETCIQLKYKVPVCTMSTSNWKVPRILYSRLRDTTRFDLDIKGLTRKSTAREITQRKPMDSGGAN